MSSIEEFAKLRFRVDCSEIKIERSGDFALTAFGPGEIWQDDFGVIQFKIYVGCAYGDFIKDMGRSRPLGSIADNAEYFKMSITEFGGKKWEAENVLPSGTRGGMSRGGALYGDVQELKSVGSDNSELAKDELQIRLRGLIPFPCNIATETVVHRGGKAVGSELKLNAARIVEGDYQLEIAHSDEHTFLHFSASSGKLHGSSYLRIQEALQFCLGCRIDVLVLESYIAQDNCGTRLFSTFGREGKYRVLPPHRFKTSLDNPEVWSIFFRYFAYVNSDERQGMHPLSNHIAGVIESSASSLEAEVLGLSVAAEGVAGDCFKGLAPVSSEAVSEIDRAVEVIETSKDFSPELNKRLTGALRAMKASRNSDKLRAFIDGNGLNRELLTSWSKLRHTSAHGGGIGGRQLEIVIKRKTEVLYLFYALILCAINYRGRRTNYSAENWPDVLP